MHIYIYTHISYIHMHTYRHITSKKKQIQLQNFLFSIFVKISSNISSARGFVSYKTIIEC